MYRPTRHTLFRLLIALLLVTAGAHAQVQQYTDLTVGGIEFDTRNGSDVDAQALRAQMKTKVGEKFSQLDFDEDLKKLSEEYDRVEPTVVMRNEKLYLNISLTTRPTIRDITFTGNEHYSARKLRKELEVKSGTIFDRHTFNANFNKLREFYTKKGYFEAELSYTVQPVSGANEIDINVCVSEGRTGHVRGIGFKGFTKKERRQLLEMIRTKKQFALTSWITQSGVYQEEMVEQDRYIVLNFLHDHGYADADVQVEVNEAPDGKGIVVTFVATRGEVYHFGKITFQGNTLFDDERIEKQIHAKEDEPYSPEQVRNTVKAISDLYGTKGHIDAVVNYEPRLIPSQRVYDVDFDISEGRQYRVGMVRIFGNQCTEQGVILNESQLVPGEVFDVRRLQQTEAILRNIGYFETVNVYAVRSPQEAELGPDYRDVHIEVQETSTGTFGVFGGASTDQNFFAGVELVEKNFNYKGLACLGKKGISALRGGGEFLRLRANFGKRNSSYTLSWTKPFFRDTCWVVGFDANRSINGLRSDDYRIRTSGISFRADYPFNRFTRLGLHYRFRYEDVTIKDHKSASQQLQEQAKNQGTVTALGATIAYDSVDFLRTRGFQSNLNLELAAPPGKFHFFTLSYLNAYYLSLIEKFVMKVRWDARFVQPVLNTKPVNIPMGERLFLGGESTVRGYKPSSLGPHFPAPDENDPTGGLSSMLLSAELKRCIVPRVDGFIFIDGGYVSAHPFDVETFRWAAGFGTRVEVMPNVPLILGWGFPINAERKSDEGGFFFSIGGRF